MVWFWSWEYFYTPGPENQKIVIQIIWNIWRGSWQQISDKVKH